jgi:dTDP-glucose 4,6-dehydratase
MIATNVVPRVFSRAVVTGGAGFLGSHLCGRLLAMGCAVVCVDNLSTGSAANVGRLAGNPLFETMHHDITEAVDVDGKVDLVLHFASPASPPDYLRLPIDTLRVGSQGTLHALDLAARKAARFVLASTSEVYGDPLEHPQRESYWGNVNPIGPRGVYDEAKRYAEALTTAYRDDRGVDTAIVRIFNSYGPRMRLGDGRAIPNFICQALRDEPLTVTGDGTHTRSVCFVSDTVDGVLALAGSGCAGPVNIGSPDELTVLQLATRVRDVAGSRSSITFVERPTDDPNMRKPDISLARQVLGWQPRTDLTTGLGQTIPWFADQLRSRHGRSVERRATLQN